MYQAYSRIFERVGINTRRPVVADSGAIGDPHAHEFMALSAIGEDTNRLPVKKVTMLLISKKQKSFTNQIIKHLL